MPSLADRTVSARFHDTRAEYCAVRSIHARADIERRCAAYRHHVRTRERQRDCDHRPPSTWGPRRPPSLCRPPSPRLRVGNIVTILVAKSCANAPTPLRRFLVDRLRICRTAGCQFVVPNPQYLFIVQQITTNRINGVSATACLVNAVRTIRQLCQISKIFQI